MKYLLINSFVCCFQMFSSSSEPRKFLDSKADLEKTLEMSSLVKEVKKGVQSFYDAIDKSSKSRSKVRKGMNRSQKKHVKPCEMMIFEYKIMKK